MIAKKIDTEKKIRWQTQQNTKINAKDWLVNSLVSIEEVATGCQNTQVV